jgi:hypothetical protein
MDVKVVMNNLSNVSFVVVDFIWASRKHLLGSISILL